MALVDALVCSECGRSFSGTERATSCPDHDGGSLDVRYDEDRLARSIPTLASSVGETLWQFDPVLPTGTERVVLGAGGTPLLDAPTLSASLDVSIRLKDETGNPTGSIKDRAGAVLVSRAAATESVVGCASTGNQAAAVAAYAARAGLDCRVFVPGDVDDGTAVRPLVSGADVYAVEGDYDDAVDLCRRVSAERGWYDCSSGVNPYGVEGLRTVGLELGAETAGDVPDWVVVPMGNGSVISAAWKGLAECYRHGVIERTPRLLGVQAEGTSPIHEQFTGESATASGTTADSIDVGRPHDADRACRSLTDSDGASITVPDDAIRMAERAIGHAEGVHAEPASAATVAGVESAIERGIVDRGADVVCLLTGGGHDDADGARSLVDEVDHVPLDPAAIPVTES